MLSVWYCNDDTTLATQDVLYLDNQTQIWTYTNGLVQQRRNSSVLAMELLCLCYTNPSIWAHIYGKFMWSWHFV